MTIKSDPTAINGDDDDAPKGRNAAGRFTAGNSGRPKGSRNKLGEDFIGALQEDFAKHGKKTISVVRAEDPSTYLKVIASLLPKELTVRTEHDLTDEQLDSRIRELAAAISLEIAGSEAGAGDALDGAQAPLRPN